MTTPRTLDFYFDYVSPFSYFAWPKIVDFCNRNKLELRIHPIVFGKLLDFWGQLGPAEIAPKREWVFKHCYRYAHLNGLEFNPPKYHPFNPLQALRLSLKQVCGRHQHQVITAIFDAGWSQGKDIGDLQELILVLNKINIDGAALALRINKPAIKECLINKTNKAIEKGVFGVPTSIVGEQLFWGYDQLEHIKLHISGIDPLSERRQRELLLRQPAVVRKI